MDLLVPGQGLIAFYLFIFLIFYNTIPCLNVLKERAWKTWWEKEKMLASGIFSFTHHVLYPINPLPDDKIVDWSKLKQIVDGIFSSPEHEVLMVSYWDSAVSVVRRPSCVVRRASSVVNFLPCVRSRGHSFGRILMKVGQDVCLDEISDEFENGSCGVKN